MLGDENESLLTKALVTIQCSYELKTENNELNYEICTINIDSKLKWHLMDGIVNYCFKRYLTKIDPNNSLCLTKHSIEKYFIGDIVRTLNDPKVPDLLPFGYLVGDNRHVKIVLKDDSKNLDSLAFETLTPKYLLEDYFSVLENNRLLAINSSQKFGKTYLMRKMAQFLSKK